MRATFLAGILLLSGAVLFGQSISSPNDIVVFSASASGSELPPGALARAGQEIRDVFVNLGSYTITSIDKHITQDEIATLMEKLKEYKSAGTGQGRKIGIEAPPLSSAEMRQLSQSLMIVVPVVTSYTPRPSPSGGYTAELETSFTFISGESADAVGHFSIRAIGLGPTAGAAASSSETCSLSAGIESIALSSPPTLATTAQPPRGAGRAGGRAVGAGPRRGGPRVAGQAQEGGRLGPTGGQDGGVAPGLQRVHRLDERVLAGRRYHGDVCIRAPKRRSRRCGCG